MHDDVCCVGTNGSEPGPNRRRARGTARDHTVYGRNCY